MWCKINKTHSANMPKSFAAVLVNELQCPYRDLHFWPEIHCIMSQTTLYNESMHLLCICVFSAHCFLSNQCWHLAQSILIYAGKWSAYTQRLEVWGRGCKIGTSCSQWISFRVGTFFSFKERQRSHNWQFVRNTAHLFIRTPLCFVLYIEVSVPLKKRCAVD